MKISRQHYIEKKKLCIICGDPSKKYSSEEHIFPESLVKYGPTLKKGIVCDNCNNKGLSQADKTFQDWKPISFYKVWFGGKTKKRKFPRAQIGELEFVKKDFKNIQIIVPSKDAVKINVKPNKEVNFSINIVFDQPTLLPSVFLHKVVLELIARDFGHDTALLPQFDILRNFIKRKTGQYRHFSMCDCFIFQTSNYKWLMTKDRTLIGLLLCIAGRLFIINILEDFHLKGIVKSIAPQLGPEMRQWMIFKEDGKILERISG